MITNEAVDREQRVVVVERVAREMHADVLQEAPELQAQQRVRVVNAHRHVSGRHVARRVRSGPVGAHVASEFAVVRVQPTQRREIPIRLSVQRLL